MSAEGFGERFYSWREPMWHRLGIVSEEAMSALQAFLKVGYYDLKLESLVTRSGIAVPNVAIVRSPTWDDPQHKILGVVSEDYETISPYQVCSAFDRKVSEPIETLGALKEGSLFFISIKMPSCSILGDETVPYLLIDAPMNGGGVWIRQVDIRTVCWNTLMAARDRTAQYYRIRHTYGALARFEEWLEYAWQKAVLNIENVQQLFEFLAKVRVPENDVPELLYQVYPDPKRPIQDAPDYVMETREETFERNLRWYQNERSLAEQLFKGAGVGQDTPAASGTAWGLWNAVVELCDYGGQGDPDVQAREAVFGWRSRIKESAFSTIYNYAISV